LLHHILDVDGIEWNGAAAQLRYVETLQAIIVEGWFLLWKNERLVSLALAVYVPELSRGPVPFDAIDIENVMKREAEKFK
jgi:hypothetical protein